MRRISTEITIDAPAARVWELLTDFPRYPDWNPFIQRIEGRLEVGAPLSAYLQLPGGRGQSFAPEVVAVEPERTFAWLGRLGVSGLFDGRHFFEIEPLGDEQCRFTQREEFTGLLAGLFLHFISDDTERGFNLMNEALKEQAEADAV